MGNQKLFFIGLLVGFIIGIYIGAGVTIINSTQHWREESIKRGYAEYNKKTGIWQWKEVSNVE